MTQTPETFVVRALSGALEAFGLACGLETKSRPAQGRTVVRITLVPAPDQPLSPRRWGLVAASLQSLAEAALVARGTTDVAVEVSGPERPPEAGEGAEAEDGLVRAAREAARRAAATGRAFALGPMNPVERRLVHQAIGELPDVWTQSDGEGIYRRLWVVPRRGKGAEHA